MTHPTTRLAVGDRVPDFTLTDAHGDRVTLEDLLGRRTIIYFYPKAFTPGCTTEACDFRDHQAPLAEHGYRTVGISPDDVDTLHDFAQQNHLPFTLLSDPGSETARAWGAWGERDINGVRSDGPVRTTITMDSDGTVLSAEYAVSAPGHVANLLASLGS